MSDIRDRLNEVLEKREVVFALKEVANIRLAFCSEEEQLEVEALTQRALHPQCAFDREHRLMLYALAVAPDQVGWSFRLRERIHRLLHKH
jgi:hypothetical protein